MSAVRKLRLHHADGRVTVEPLTRTALLNGTLDGRTHPRALAGAVMVTTSCRRCLRTIVFETRASATCCDAHSTCREPGEPR